MNNSSPLIVLIAVRSAEYVTLTHKISPAVTTTRLAINDRIKGLLLLLIAIELVRPKLPVEPLGGRVRLAGTSMALNGALKSDR
jgi:hypothetical protein